MKIINSKTLVISMVFVSMLIITTLTKTMAQNEYNSVKDAKGLAVGDQVTEFTALDLHDNTFNLKKALKKGPVVVIFYRGQWCPFCNNHLRNLQDSLQLIYAKGASVIAISPEKSAFLKQTAEKTGAEFSLLYDEGYKISDLFDVTFRPDYMTRNIYNTMLGADLKNAHSDNSEQLPIPATFIIAQDGKIVWRQFDPNYKIRSTVSDIVKNIP